MRNRKKNSRFQKSTAALLAVAMILLAGSAVGSTRAALTYFSDNYSAQMNTPELGVTPVSYTHLSRALCGARGRE